MSNPSKPTRQSVREQRAKKRSQQRRLVAIVMVVAGAGLILLLALPSIINALKPAGEISVPEFRDYEMADFNSLGSADAPIVIVEYSDFQCPFCKQFSDETEPLLITNYINTGKVRLVFVPYGPGGNYIGRESEDAANAAFCAAEQGKFWQYKEIIFANHSGENVGDYTEKRLVSFAEALELDMDQFNECFTNKTYAAMISEGIQQGRSNSVGGTPTFIINDGAEVLPGAYPFSAFEEVLERLLSR